MRGQALGRRNIARGATHRARPGPRNHCPCLTHSVPTEQAVQRRGPPGSAGSTTNKGAGGGGQASWPRSPRQVANSPVRLKSLPLLLLRQKKGASSPLRHIPGTPRTPRIRPGKSRACRAPVPLARPSGPSGRQECLAARSSDPILTPSPPRPGTQGPHGPTDELRDRFRCRPGPAADRDPSATNS
jgi:hypothetical protein